MTLGSRRWLANAVDRKKRTDLEAFRAKHNGYGLAGYSLPRMPCGPQAAVIRCWLYLSHRDFKLPLPLCTLRFARWLLCVRSHLPDLTFGQRMLLMGRKDTRYARCDPRAVTTGSAVATSAQHASVWHAHFASSRAILAKPASVVCTTLRAGTTLKSLMALKSH